MAKEKEFDDILLTPNKQEISEEPAVYKNVKSLKYNEEQQTRLVKEILEEETAIDEERRDVHGEDYDQFCKSMDNQYAGVMPRREGQIFNVDTGITSIKVDRIIGDSMEAILGVEPRISVVPRPGFAQTDNGQEICNRQEQFLDYAMDERLPVDLELEKAAKNGALKRVGIVKLSHKVVIRKRVRHEFYSGKIEMSEDGIAKIPGLESLLEAHADRIKEDPDKYAPYIRKLQAGKDAEFDAEYNDVIYNDPFVESIKPENFKVRKSVSSYEDLADTELTIELREFTYWELKKLEKTYDFINVDKLLYADESDERNKKERDGARNEKYCIRECVKYFKEKEDSAEEPKKIVCFISKDRDIYLGGIYYSFTVLDCQYFPVWVKMEGDGFYQGSIAKDLTSAHIADTALLVMILDGVWKRNTMTPITPEDSPVDQQISSHLWIEGMPLHARPDEIDFLNKYMPQLDLNAMLASRESVQRIADDKSRVSQLKTGTESRLDPTAPAQKTRDLIMQSDAGIRKYTTNIAKAFNRLATGILQMYYEISQNDQKYLNKRIGDVTNNKDIFKVITRQQMIAKTSIQSMSYAYNFDKQREKEDWLTFYKLFRQEMLIAKSPERVLYLLQTIGKSWSPAVKNALHKLLPDMAQMKQEEMMVAIQAVAIYTQQVIKEAQMTGQQPQFDPEQMLAVIGKMREQMVNFPSKEEMKAQQKGANENTGIV